MYLKGYLLGGEMINDWFWPLGEITILLFFFSNFLDGNKEVDNTEAGFIEVGNMEGVYILVIWKLTLLKWVI